MTRQERTRKLKFLLDPHGFGFHIHVSAKRPRSFIIIYGILGLMNMSGLCLIVQWGWPTVSIGAVLGLLCGVMTSTIESLGDYYACASIASKR